MVERKPAIIAFDDISHNGEAEPGAGLRFVGAKAAAGELVEGSQRATRTIVLNRKYYTFVRHRLHVEPYAGSAPFAGIVEQIAEQLEQVFLIAGELCFRRDLPTDVRMLGCVRAKSAPAD